MCEWVASVPQRRKVHDDFCWFSLFRKHIQFKSSSTMIKFSCCLFICFLSFVCSSTTGSSVVDEGLIDQQEFLAKAQKLIDDRSSPAGLRAGGRQEQECEPADVNLADYQQWEDETGYWVGEYSFFGPSGETFESASWPYRYDQYKGFITGAVSGNAYRQRNVFLYPPLPLNDNKKCLGNKPEVPVVGEGSCGMNGNTKIFYADQTATTCSDNEESGGDIEGDFAGLFNTYTQLVGKENAVLYQVYVKPNTFLGITEEVLFQSQLTTITRGANGEVYRTRSAQGFDAFTGTQSQRYLSFYRERKVPKDEFYALLAESVEEYNILESDLCAWEDGSVGGVQPSTYAADPGLEACTTHLEETFLINP